MSSKSRRRTDVVRVEITEAPYVPNVVLREIATVPVQATIRESCYSLPVLTRLFGILLASAQSMFTSSSVCKSSKKSKASKLEQQPNKSTADWLAWFDFVSDHSSIVATRKQWRREVLDALATFINRAEQDDSTLFSWSNWSEHVWALLRMIDSRPVNEWADDDEDEFLDEIHIADPSTDLHPRDAVASADDETPTPHVVDPKAVPTQLSVPGKRVSLRQAMFAQLLRRDALALPPAGFAWPDAEQVRQFACGTTETFVRQVFEWQTNIQRRANVRHRLIGTPQFVALNQFNVGRLSEMAERWAKTGSFSENAIWFVRGDAPSTQPQQPPCAEDEHEWMVVCLTREDMHSQPSVHVLSIRRGVASSWLRDSVLAVFDQWPRLTESQPLIASRRSVATMVTAFNVATHQHDWSRFRQWTHRRQWDVEEWYATIRRNYVGDATLEANTRALNQLLVDMEAAKQFRWTDISTSTILQKMRALIPRMELLRHMQIDTAIAAGQVGRLPASTESPFTKALTWMVFRERVAWLSENDAKHDTLWVDQSLCNAGSTLSRTLLWAQSNAALDDGGELAEPIRDLVGWRDDEIGDRVEQALRDFVKKSSGKLTERDLFETLSKAHPRIPTFQWHERNDLLWSARLEDAFTIINNQERSLREQMRSECTLRLPDFIRVGGRVDGAPATADAKRTFRFATPLHDVQPRGTMEQFLVQVCIASKGMRTNLGVVEVNRSREEAALLDLDRLIVNGAAGGAPAPSRAALNSVMPLYVKDLQRRWRETAMDGVKQAERSALVAIRYHCRGGKHSNDESCDWMLVELFPVKGVVHFYVPHAVVPPNLQQSDQVLQSLVDIQYNRVLPGWDPAGAAFFTTDDASVAYQPFAGRELDVSRPRSIVKVMELYVREHANELGGMP